MEQTEFAETDTQVSANIRIIGEPPRDTSLEPVEERSVLMDYLRSIPGILRKNKEQIVQQKAAETEFTQSFERSFPDTELQEAVVPHAIVFLHGQGRNAEMWRLWIKELRNLNPNMHIRMVAISLPKFDQKIPEDPDVVENIFKAGEWWVGTGNLDMVREEGEVVRGIDINSRVPVHEKRPNKLVGQDVNMENVAEFVFDELKKMGINGPVTVVGHSLGGLVGAVLASNHPDKVANLITISSPYKANDRDYPIAFSKVIKVVRKLSDTPQSAIRQAREVFAFLLDKDIDEQNMVSFVLENTPKSFASLVDRIREIDWESVLSRIPDSVRTVCYFKKNDAVVRAMRYQASTSLQNATLVYDPVGGHNMVEPIILRRMVASIENSYVKKEPPVIETD